MQNKTKQKNTLYTYYIQKLNSKWFIDCKCNCEFMKFLKENTAENLYNIGLAAKKLFDTIAKVLSIKGKKQISWIGWKFKALESEFINRNWNKSQSFHFSDQTWKSISFLRNIQSRVRNRTEKWQLLSKPFPKMGQAETSDPFLCCLIGINTAFVVCLLWAICSHYYSLFLKD